MTSLVQANDDALIDVGSLQLRVKQGELATSTDPRVAAAPGLWDTVADLGSDGGSVPLRELVAA